MILKRVSKPSRYIGYEWNSYHKSWTENNIKICFCFPDLYEIGASNLGIEILYHIVNSREDSLAERCFAPELDMEELLRKENIPLFSLESKSPINKFDLIGFSLQYELCFTNVLNILDLGKIPVFKKDRKEIFPLIIAGGPICSSNTKPVEDFFDFFVIGEAEEIIHKIIDTINNFKNNNKQNKQNKNDLLKNLSEIEGVYIPEFKKDIKRITVDIEKSFYPVKFIVPYTQTVHNRLNIEISRGCVYKCNFCQATNLYHPWRERSIEKIMYLIKEGIENTGYEQFSLGSFSVSNYSKIDNLMINVSDFSKRTKTFFSVPSLRCNLKSIRILKYLILPRRSGLTFAIEAGTERLRKFINKDISEQDIFETLSEVNKLGWKLVKLYFMIGLPTETQEDIDGIVKLVKKIKNSFPKLEFNITVSPFVPKPKTPFENFKQENIQTLFNKQNILFKCLNIRGINLKFHDVYAAHLEWILSSEEYFLLLCRISLRNVLNF